MELPNQNDNQVIRYEYIINKLYNTLEAYGEIFPQLLQVRESLPPQSQEIPSCGDPCQGLPALLNLLKGRAVKDYIVRHLYHNFRREVEDFQQGIPFDEEKKFYIDIPG
ncbi:MAG: hypothetical protein ACO1O1_01290 [Adhaeribacter sp.]